MGLHLLTKYGWNHKIPIKGTTCDRLISFVQEVIMGEGGGGEATWVYFYWVFTTGLSKPLPHYLFNYRPHQ